MLYHALIYSGEKTTLLAFWDGRSGSGLGGTQDIIRRTEEHDVDPGHINTLSCLVCNAG